jgi:flagellar basal body rod protein FlgG
MRFDIPLSALHTTARRQALRANNVANLNTPGYQPLDAQPAERPGGGVALGPVQVSGSNVELAEELTGTLLDLRTAQANIGVLRAQDELLGETLDLLA